MKEDSEYDNIQGLIKQNTTGTNNERRLHMCNSGSYGCLAQRSGRLLGLRLRSIELSIQGRLQIPARNQKYLIISIIAFQHKVCNGRGLTLIYTFQVQHSLHRSERNAVVTTRCWIRR